MVQNRIKELCAERGYNSFNYLGQWNGFDVYEPDSDSDEGAGAIPSTGLPFFFLAQGEEVRVTAPNEAFEILDALYPDEEEPEEEDLEDEDESDVDG